MQLLLAQAAAPILFSNLSPRLSMAQATRAVLLGHGEQDASAVGSATKFPVIHGKYREFHQFLPGALESDAKSRLSSTAYEKTPSV
jgi:hypothetical protein